MDYDMKLQALKVASTTHGQTIVQADTQGGVTIERAEQGAVVRAASEYLAFLVDDTAPEGVRSLLDDLGQLMVAQPAAWAALAAVMGGDDLEVSLLAQPGDEASRAAATTMADRLRSIARWAQVDAEPF